MKKIEISEEEFNSILPYFKDGKSIRDIAKILNLSKSTFHRRLKLFWEKYPGTREKCFPIKIPSKDDLYRMHVIEKKSILQISKITNMYYYTILKYQKIYNIPHYDYRAKKGKSHFAWKGYEEIPGWFLNRTKSGAENRKISFDINGEELWEQWSKQNGKCAISGVKLQFSYTKNRHETTASLDRIDSSKGYIKGNIQWVHKWVNLMKLDFSQDEFIDWCQKIIDYRKNNEN